MSSNNYFSSSNKSRMLSNAYTDINQGGGNKKAGFPSMIGRDSWTSIAINTCRPQLEGSTCCDLKSYQRLIFTQPVNQSRPVGMDSRIRYR